MQTTPKITAISPWFGSKRNLAPEIVAELGEHRVYWEPFCGSMAVLMVKPACLMETVNDLHGDLVNLARVIQHDELGPRLYRRLRRSLMSEVLHREAAERHASRGYLDARDLDAPDLEAAFDYFLCSWNGRNGVAGTQSYNQVFCRRFTAKGGHASKRWASVVDSIPAWRRRIRNVTILCDDAFGLLPRIDDSRGTSIYCDPPYLEKGAKYVHDFTPADHQKLAEQLGRFRYARVVVSYYEHPALAELYPGWTKRQIEVSKAMANQGQRGKSDSRALEVLLMNGPSYARDPQRGLFE